MVPFSRRLRGCADKSTSVVINNGDGGGTVSREHVYGPPFGLIGAGDLSIVIDERIGSMWGNLYGNY